MRTNRQSGAALLAVLWMTVALSFIALTLASTVRTEVEATHNLVDSERGYFLARGALDAALLQLTSPAPPAIRRELRFELETGTATVEIQPETAKWDVRTAPLPVLSRLFQKLGLTPQESEELVLAIEKRRASQIRSLDELLPLRRMTLDLFYGAFVHGRRPPLSDLLTLRGSGAQVDVNFAHPLLLAALPGMNDDLAARIVEARSRKPFESMAQVAEILPGIGPEALGYLGMTNAQAITLIAHGRAKGADLERTVRLTFIIEARNPMGYRLVDWMDN